MKPKHIISFLASLMIIIACQDKKKEEAISAIKEWMGKEILFGGKQGVTNISSRQGEQNRSYWQSHRESQRQEILSETAYGKGTGNVRHPNNGGTLRSRIGFRHFSERRNKDG